MIESGTILQDRYRVEKQIGQGGMGTVFVAVDERFGSKVAIKNTFFDDPNLKKAFEREARLLNSLKHPALPKVNDFFTEDDKQFIVMEYIAGEDLSERMEKSGEAYPLEDVLNWGNQLCDALEYLHSQEIPIIHRDIKPQNLKLTPDGQIILLDFGLAKGNPVDSSHLTAAKSIFGYSRNYASLEQMQGTGTDPRSDLYSLAATLYHLMSGVAPADALTRAMNVLNDQADPLIPAHLAGDDVPPGVADILQKTMALNAAERPASAVQFRKMLAESDKSMSDGPARVTAANAAAASTDILKQETKIMPADTNIQDLGNAKVKTEVLPKNFVAGESLETRVVEKGGTTQDEEIESFGVLSAGGSGGRMRGFVSAAVGLLLIAGVASGLYLYSNQGNAEQSENPNLNSSFASDDQTEDESGSPEENEMTEVEDGQDSETADSPSSPAETVKQKPDRVNKSGGKTKKGSDPTEAEREEFETRVENERQRTVVGQGKERVVIDGDRIETDTMIVDGKKIYTKKPGTGTSVTVATTPLTPKEIEGLTPEQKKKIKDLRRIRREQMKNKKKRPPPPRRPRPRNNRRPN